jgi:hypothetical protein
VSSLCSLPDRRAAANGRVLPPHKTGLA